MKLVERLSSMYAMYTNSILGLIFSKIWSSKTCWTKKVKYVDRARSSFSSELEQINIFVQKYEQ